MRTLSDTLLAAQQSGSARPHLCVRLADRDAGAARLRWQRWYTGVEPDGPCGAATPDDGALLRARIDPADGALSYQRVATPGPSSDYSAWTALGTVVAGPRLGLTAAGTRALLASVRVGGVGIEVRESTDSGASFGASALVMTAGGTVTAVTCALQSDGSAAVFYAAGGTVYAVTRSGTGAWSSPAAWSLSLASVSALAAYFELDYNVLVSGVDAAGGSGAWATLLGIGGVAPPGVWMQLSEVAAASAGTSVSYLATGAARLDVPRALIVESYSGGGAYDRVHVADGLALSLWSDFVWREPRPFDRASAYGLAVAGAGAISDDGWLCSSDGVWHATVVPAVTELTADVLAAELVQSLDGGRLRVTLNNEDGRYGPDAAPAALAAGGELVVELGYETSAGAESSSGPVFWISSLRRVRRAGRSTVELDAVDGWGLLRAWRATRQQVWGAGTTPVSQLLREIAGRAGLSGSLSGASAEAGALQPAFTVRAGERGVAVGSRLAAMLPDVLLMFRYSVFLREPAAGDRTDYAYGVAHPVQELEIDGGGRRVGWARVFGEGAFAEAVDGAALLDGAGATIEVDAGLAAQARADARAATLLRGDVLATERGRLTAAANVGQEMTDVVTVADDVLAMRPFPYAFPLSFATVSPTKFRVSSLRLRFDRGAKPRYDSTLTLIEV